MCVTRPSAVWPRPIVSPAMPEPELRQCRGKVKVAMKRVRNISLEIGTELAPNWHRTLRNGPGQNKTGRDKQSHKSLFRRRKMARGGTGRDQERRPKTRRSRFSRPVPSTTRPPILACGRGKRARPYTPYQHLSSSPDLYPILSAFCDA